MCLNIGDVFPDFSAKTTAGDIQFHEWLDKSFGKSCTAELKRIADMMPELKKRKIKPIALACSDIQTLLEWINNIRNSSGERINQFPYPIIVDSDRRLSTLLSILDLEQLDSDRLPLAGRAVLFIDPDAKLRLRILYPTSTNLNLLEIIRAMESVQQVDKDKAEAQQEVQIKPAPTALQGMSTEAQGANPMSVLWKTLPNFDFLNNTPLTVNQNLLTKDIFPF